jgi:hypothetical protein
MRYSRTLAALALGLVAVAGCKKKESPTVGADSSAIATPPPVVAFEVKSVDLGKAIDADKRVTNSSDNFARTDTIYASVTTEGSAPSKTLVANWTFQDGQVVKSDTMTISPTGPAVTEFHIMKPTRWPAGKYKVEIVVDGQTVQTKDFEVK